nr:6-hydroxymethylpterin diphosphokinase MptE-like protein [Clostridium botulinum]
MLKLEVGNKGFYTLKFNNKYIHSKYDPVKESDVFINKHQELLTNKIIVVYGLGLGYHIYNILSKVNENTTIIVFEWNEEVVRICREMGLDLFKRNNVKIFTKNEKFYIKLQEYLKLVKDIIIYKPCLETIKEENIKLYDLINEYDLNRKSIQKNKQLLMENYKNNINCNNKNIKELIKYYKDIKKTYIIIAAGPSLDYSINKLKKYRDDYIIISVGSALMTLNDSGVIPDIITIIDGQKVVENQFKGFNRDDVPLCFLSTASRWAVNKYNGPKYIFLMIIMKMI